MSLLLLLTMCSTAYAQDFTVSGTVTDASNGGALPGVNVQVEGTTIGTATGVNGQYTLNVPDATATLQFSYLGFETTTVPIDERSVIDVSLEPTTLTGSEIVVVGYSTQRRRDLTGSVEVVDTENLQRIPEARITDQLQGMASGVSVISSGQPGQDPQIRIRGINTFGNNAPLFVVDGIATQSVGDLNPDNIASLQVLKDASAASIYGSRASNGVVIIETKQGEGNLSVQLNTYAGISKQPDETNPWEMLDPQGRAELKLLAQCNSGITPSDPQYTFEGGCGGEVTLPDYILPAGAMEGDAGTDASNYFLIPEYSNADQASAFNQIVRANKAGTDWFDEIMQTAPMMKTDLTVSGGGDQGNYLLSVGYLNQEGTLLRTYLERYSLRANTTYNVNDHIRIGENLSYSVEENQLDDVLVEGSAIGMAMRQRPIIPIYDIMGNWAGSAGNGLGNPSNPVAMRDRTRNNTALDKRVFGNVFAEVSFLQDFLFKTSFGGSVSSGYWETFAFPTYENSENNARNALTENAYNNLDWTFSNTLNYNHTFAQNHNVSVLAGTEWLRSDTRWEEASVESFFSFDPNFTNLANGSGTKTTESETRVTTLVSQFGKIDYNYRGRYFLSGTLRRDGSSKFLNDQYGIFPAASAGWRISEESFMDGVFSWLTDLKVRAGWGVMGNQLNVTPNNAYSLFASRTYAYDITGSNATPSLGFVASQIGAPDAKWEKDKNLNLGVDIAVFDGQLEATVDYYKKDIEDLLYDPELPAPAGQADAPFINVASMVNTGIDASLRGQTEVGGVQINGSVNFTTYNNEITALAEGFDSFSEESRRFNASNIVRNEVGQEMSSYYGYQVVGFFQEDDFNDTNDDGEITSEDELKDGVVAQTDPGPGRFRYKDVDGDGEITPDDRTFLGSPNPDFTYGINLSFAYDSWDLSLSLFGSQGAEIWNQVKWWTDFFSGFNGAKSEVALNDSWTPDNADATAPIQETERSFSTNQVPNSYFVEDGSYLRIQNIQLGYTLPSRWTQRLGAQRLRLYVQASNLYTFTGYSNPDPEIGGSDATDVTSFGIDEGSFPTPRQFIGGVNLTF